MSSPLSSSLGWRAWLVHRLAQFTILSTLAIIIGQNAEIAVVLVFIALSLVLYSLRGEKSHTLVRRLLITATLLSVLEYVQGRTSAIEWSGWFVALPLIGAELFGLVHMLGFQYTQWYPAEPRPTPKDYDSKRGILVLVPTVNEGRDVVAETLRATLLARDAYLQQYPHTPFMIALCNDGYVAGVPRWQDMEALAQELGLPCVTRTVGGGAKAGNIEQARQQLAGDAPYLLVVFDADQAPTPDFFLKTLPHFADERLGWVQTGQYYRNTEQTLARWADNQMRFFYDVICPQKATQNALFLCGTNFVLRSEALDAIGGLPQDSVTEDFTASLLMHANGWQSIYLTDRLAYGLGPVDFKSYFSQQHRWALGTLSACLRYTPLLFNPFNGRFSLKQRFQYWLSGTHYLCGLRDAIFVSAPFFYLLFGVNSVKAELNLVSLFMLYWLVSMGTMIFIARGKASVFQTIVVEFACTHRFVQAWLQSLVGRRFRFKVTGKQYSTRRNWTSILIYMGLSVAIVFAVTYGYQNRFNAFNVLVNGLWLGYRFLIVVGIVWLSFRIDREAQQALAG
jgi:cellulose synthase/poly-beta-1,6-N-acetylglucosamine synthase-like glycosyltransferase